MAETARAALLSGNWDNIERSHQAASSLATKAEKSETNPLPGRHISPWDMHILEIIPLEEKKTIPKETPEPPGTLFDSGEYKKKPRWE